MESLIKEDQGRHVYGHLECHSLGSGDKRIRSSRSGPIFKEKKKRKRGGRRGEGRESHRDTRDHYCKAKKATELSASLILKTFPTIYWPISVVENPSKVCLNSAVTTDESEASTVCQMLWLPSKSSEMVPAKEQSPRSLQPFPWSPSS